MAVEFVVKIPDRAGQLASLTSALADAKVQLRGIGASKGSVGILVADKDAARARRALKKAGYRAKEGKAVEVRLQDKPGSLARSTKRFAKARVNISSVYVLSPGRGSVGVAYAVKDARGAKKALGR